MAKKKVIVSFDYEHDNYFYYLLKAWDKNSDFDFSFSDCTPKEIATESVSTIKQVLSTKIHGANYMIAIIGEHSNDQHPDHAQIGYRNWQAYEIDKNHDWGNELVIVKTKKDNSVPSEALGIGAHWAMSFTEDAIVKALNECGK